MQSFAHLHVHTEYSLLDGASRVGKLLDRVKALGMTSCAITDHGVMYGIVDFYSAAKERGIHPVIGCEAYVVNNMRDKTPASRENFHLVLLCENETGYRNLIRLASLSFTEGFYYRPRVDFDLLREHSEGLIALSACLSGEIATLLLARQYDAAKQSVQRYIDIFGENNFYIEIQDHGIPEQRQILPQLVSLAHEMNIPLVATNDIHYLTREDSEAHDVLLCIQTNKTVTDTDRMRMSSDQFYIKSPDEMAALFRQWPEAIENTRKIAERCRVSFDFSTIHLPRFPLPDGEDPFDLLRQLCEEGFSKRYDPADAVARERLEYELSMIHRMGYVDYFLIVWDYVKFAKDHGILVGPGRGSGAASIAAYSLDITGLDPLKYNLLFERFLNPERISMPDFDIDFCYERRQEVIDYVISKYGADHVAQIITFGTMAAKAAIRDVGRALGYPYAQVDQVAKMVPFSLDMTLDKAVEVSPDLADAVKSDERIEKLVRIARALEGLPRHASTHAAGVLVTNKPVCDYVPLQTNDAVVTTQFPMGTLEKLGLLKMDFLGLRTLTVLDDTLTILRAKGISLTLEDIPMNDPEIYRMISKGDTDGVFQLEGDGMRSFLTNLEPSCFEDIIAALSLYRPGPMDSIPRYIEGKRNPGSISYLHPLLEPILSVTYGCMVYQEQIMQIVRDVAGYSLGRSDLMRRAMAKKKKDVMAKEREYFIHGLMDGDKVSVPGAVRMGVPDDVAERMFEEMGAFASYAFNKPHAAAYAVISVQTAYLKRYYPAAFMAALMNNQGGAVEKIAQYAQYCRKQGIRILPPDVNRSRLKFSVDMDDNNNECIRFGLGAIKNVGDAAVADIIREREKEGPFTDIFTLVKRVDSNSLNKRMLESLIYAGALDGFGAPRPQLLRVYEQALDAADRLRKLTSKGQISLFGDLLPDTAEPLPTGANISRSELLTMEKAVTGVYISGHPLDQYRELLEKYPHDTRFIRSLAEQPDGGLSFDGMTITIGGIVTAVRTKVTKNGGLMAFITLEDLTGEIECLVFPKTYEWLRKELAVEVPLSVTGRLSVREDEAPKLLVSDAAPLDEADSPPVARDYTESPGADQPQPSEGQTPGRLHIKVADKNMMISALSELDRHPGSVSVCFHLDKEHRVLLNATTCDASPSLIAALAKRVGQDNVKMKTETKKEINDIGTERDTA